MKIIDLLNKIANGEEVPKKIHFKYSTYQFDEIDKVYRNINGNQQLEQDYMISNKLNDEIEILEEEKEIPEKLKWNEKSQHNVVKDNTKKTLEHLLSRSEQLKKSINEIIDYLKSKGDE